MKYVCGCGRLYKEVQTVAECKRRNHGRGGNWRTRLNKAAPELLEAAEDVIEQFRKSIVPIGPDLSDSIRVLLADAVRKAKKA